MSGRDPWNNDSDPWEWINGSYWFGTKSTRSGFGGGGASGSWQSPEEWVEEELRELANARTLSQVSRVARALLGELSFEAGVIRGLIGALRTSDLSLVDLGRCLVLATIYELVETPVDEGWTPIRVSKMSIGAAPQVVTTVRRRLFSPRSWQDAYKRRRKLFDELQRVADVLPDLVLATPGAEQERLKREWARLDEMLRSWNVDAPFNAGRLFGELIAEVLSYLERVPDKDRLETALPLLLAWTLELGRGGISRPSNQSSGAPAGGGDRRGPAASRGGARVGKDSEPGSTAPPSKQSVKALPKGPRNPNAKARGTPENASGASSAKRRDVAQQNDSADRLAREGYDIEHNEDVKPNGKQPDYKISDEYVDHLNVKSNNVDQARNAISDKVKTEQADRLAVRLDDSKLSAEDVQGRLERRPVNGLKEVIFIKNDAVTSYVPSGI